MTHRRGEKFLFFFTNRSGVGVGEHTAYLSRDNTRHFFTEMRLYGASGMLGGALNHWSDCSTIYRGVFRPARKCLEKKPQNIGSQS
jgi:hypothetical protein